jgi:tetratricopeptide (TPR) repeat protein
MVPELESRGLQKEADELFKLSWDAHQKMLKEYPNSHAAQAGLAQLAGRCGRNLDEGLKYAKAAVRADRGSVGYREVLAEVHFRRGERDDAVKLMQALADEQPRNLLYKRQLVRYRTGTFDSPWPHIGGGD